MKISSYNPKPFNASEASPWFYALYLINTNYIMTSMMTHFIIYVNEIILMMTMMMMRMMMMMMMN